MFLGCFLIFSHHLGWTERLCRSALTLFSLYFFVRQTRDVSLVVTPRAVLGSLCMNHRNFGDCEVWFSKISLFYFMFLKHRAADNDSTPAVSETSRGLKKKNTEKKDTNFPLTPPSDRSYSLSGGIFWIHICTHLYKRLERRQSWGKPATAASWFPASQPMISSRVSSSLTVLCFLPTQPLFSCVTLFK